MHAAASKLRQFRFPSRVSKRYMHIQLFDGGDGRRVACCQGKYYTISEETASLIEFTQGPHIPDLRTLAKQLSARLGYEIDEPDVAAALAQLPAVFAGSAAVRTPMRWSHTLLQGNVIIRWSSVLSALFTRPAGALSLCLIVTALAYLAATPTPSVGNMWLMPALILCSVLVHEIGHAAACVAMGAEPGNIGIGMRKFIPTFFTDVSHIWSRGRSERLVVDCGGVYFQLLFAALISAIAYFLPGLLLTAKIIAALALFSMLPYFRFDGYWFLGDLIQTDDLQSWMAERWRARRAALYNRRAAVTLLLVTAYYAGFVLLHIWMVAMLYRMVMAEGINMQQLLHVAQGDRPLALAGAAIMALLLVFVSLPLVTMLLKQLGILLHRSAVGDLLSVGEFYAGRSALSLLRWSPYNSEKQRRYKSTVAASLDTVSPPIAQSKAVPARSLVSKYNEALWFWLLSRTSASAGKRFVARTHRVVSPLSFADIAATPGPAIIAAPHFGSFISGALTILDEMTRRGRIVHIMYADPSTDPNNGRFEKFYRRYFADFSVLFNTRQGILSAAKALRAGHILVIMPDVFVGENLASVPLLGRKIGVMAGIAYFSEKFDAVVYPVFSTFNGLCGVDIFVEPPLTSAGTKGDPESRVRVMAELFAVLEKWIRRAPQDWHCWQSFSKLSHADDRVSLPG